MLERWLVGLLSDYDNDDDNVDNDALWQHDSKINGDGVVKPKNPIAK